jgi:hypothetical protein
LPRDAQFGEWVLGRPPHLEQATVALGRELRSRGVAEYRLLKTRSAFVAYWHTISDSGETNLLCATHDASSLLRQIQLPAAPSLSRAEYERSEQAIVTEVSVSRADAESAALAAFRDKNGAVRQVHLYWIPIVEFSVLVAGERVSAVALGSSDRLLIASLPIAAGWPHVSKPTLILFTAYLVVMYLLGLVIHPPLLRAGILGITFVAVAFYWATALRRLEARQ